MIRHKERSQLDFVYYTQRNVVGDMRKGGITVSVYAHGGINAGTLPSLSTTHACHAMFLEAVMLKRSNRQNGVYATDHQDLCHVPEPYPECAV